MSTSSLSSASRSMLRHLLIALSLSAGLACAQDRAPVEPKSPPTPDEPVAPAKPTVERLDATHYRIGEVTFDQKTREIRFPAAVNMTEGLLEYAIVHTHGKVHESLLVTTISATHLNLAFSLLRYPPSPELYALPNEKGGLSDKFPEVDKQTKAASRIQVKIEWDDRGKTRSVPFNEWIQHATKGSAMPATLWVYGGSEIYEGKFVAETTGDIMAIFITNSALINYPGVANNDDTVWLPFPKRVPEVGTKVTVIIAPNPDAKPLSKP
jgi:hypothetical protein